MPKSRLRKNHKQKVKARNARVKIEQKKFEKQYMEAMTKKIQELESTFSGMSETEETTQDETIVNETQVTEQG